MYTLPTDIFLIHFFTGHWAGVVFESVHVLSAGVCPVSSVLELNEPLVKRAMKQKAKRIHCGNIKGKCVIII